MGDLLDLAAGRRPDAEALVVLDGARRRWTYAQLRADVDARAADLAARGVRAGDLVGLVASRREALVPSVLALLRLGAAYVPLDPRWPDARWQLIGVDARLSAVLGPPEVLAARGAALGTVPRLSWDGEVGSGAGGHGAGDADPAGPAYVIYTSGSTGAPKGVLVSQANVLARVASYLELTGGADRYLLHSSLCFDGAVGGLFSTLAAGGCLVVPGDDVADDPARVAAVVRSEGVTHLEPVPSWYAALLDLAEPGDLASVTTVILGGEVLPPALVRRSHERLPSARLVNDYGPTEATVAATAYDVPPGWEGSRVPIGRPHANTDVYVLDDDLAPVAPGEIGQLWVGGPGVALGYVGRPDDPAFRPDPFRGGRMYATGDLVSWDDEGVLDYHGRKDRQAKVRGQRVEPGEVEAVLAGVDGVAASAVEVDRAPTGDRLVAYVSAVRTGALAAGDVASALADRLPTHLRPDRIVVLDALPLTAGGKVDRRALPPPDVVPAVDGDAPVDELEQLIADAFADVLGVDHVSRSTDFVAAGGHSLAAARVAARLRRSLDVDVVPADLAEAPDPATLAALVRRRPPAATAATPPARRHRPSAEVWRVPATPRQESFWFLEQVAGGSAAANLTEYVTFPPGTDPTVLGAAVRSLVARHGALRTGLQLDGDVLVQVVVPAGAVSVAVASLGTAATGEEVRRVADDLASLPFDLAVPPLVRAGIVAGPEGPVVVLVVHHGVTDGWSTSVLVDELVATVAVGGSATALGEPALDYVDWAEWLHERMASEAAGPAVAHLGRRLAEAHRADAARSLDDRSAQGSRGGQGGLVGGRIPSATVAAVDAVARRTRSSRYQVLLASLGALLHRTSGAERLLVAAPVAGRGEPELDRLVGCCINTTLFAVDASADPTFGELVGRVSGDARADEPHRWFPVEVALRQLGTTLHESAPVLLNLVDVPPPTLEVGGVRATVETRPCTLSTCDLDIDLTPDGDGLRVDAVYRADRLDGATVERVLQRWLRVLDAALAAPDEPLSTLPVIGPDEAAVLAQLEGDPGPSPTATVLDRARRHLAEGGDRPAVIDGSATRSWGWLDRRSAVLAAGLTARGVGRGNAVLIALDGTADAVSLLVACWRLAAVPVPVGTRLPPARVDEIAALAAAAVVVDAAVVDDLVAVGERSAVRPDDLPTLDDTAYVLFTSGSTGVPKGVVVSHRALAASTDARLLAYPDQPEVALPVHDLAFDPTVGIAAQQLVTGGCVVVPGRDDRLDPERLGAMIERYGVAQIDIVPSHHRLLLDCVDASRLASLRLVTTGAEVCPPSLVAAHAAALPSARLVNEYGPTECTVWAVAHDCRPEDALLDRVPIGRPIAGVSARVADAAGRRLPLGATGELLLAGHLVADGYLGDDVRTVERFVDVEGGRWYRTGDLVRWNDAGELEFLGRIDDQVKIRGYRIEPGEVAALLMEREDVVRAVAGPVELVEGSPVLVAWVQPVAGASPGPAELRRHCQDRLPEHLVPATVVVVDDLPTTVAGKVDRSRLPRPEVAEVADVGAPPERELERRIADIWADLLGRPVGVDRDFFAAGGQSLLLARMVARVRQDLDVQLDLREVVARPRIREIADLVERNRSASAPVEASEAPRPGIDDLSRDEAAALLDRLDELTDAEVDALLARLEGGG